MKLKKVTFSIFIMLAALLTFSIKNKKAAENLSQEKNLKAIEKNSPKKIQEGSKTIDKPLDLKDYKIDQIIVEKSKRLLHLKSQNKIIKTYSVSLGDAPQGQKEQQGDEKTPEGHYVIDWRNNKSRYHLSLHIGYPKVWQKARAKILGINPGGDIMIHGLPNGQKDWGKGHLLVDWTDGCIAVTSEEIEEIWKAVPNGTPIEILP